MRTVTGPGYDLSQLTSKRKTGVLLFYPVSIHVHIAKERLFTMFLNKIVGNKFVY